MAKKKVEMEIEYPDCTICGNEISVGDKYFDLSIGLGNGIVCETGRTSGKQTDNSRRPLYVCHKCSGGLIPFALGEDPMNFSRKIILNIMHELGMQMDELNRKI